MTINNQGAALILIRDDSALMMLRDNTANIPFPNLWSLNGGKVEEGETPRNAAIRELHEETGYRANNPHYFMTELYPLEDGTLIEAHRYFEIYDQEQNLHCFEGQKLEFIPESKLNTLLAVPGHTYAASRAIALARILKTIS